MRALVDELTLARPLLTTSFLNPTSLLPVVTILANHAVELESGKVTPSHVATNYCASHYSIFYFLPSNISYILYTILLLTHTLTPLQSIPQSLTHTRCLSCDTSCNLCLVLASLSSLVTPPSPQNFIPNPPWSLGACTSAPPATTNSLTHAATLILKQPPKHLPLVACVTL